MAGGTARSGGKHPDILLIEPRMEGFERLRGFLIEPLGLMSAARLAMEEYRVAILDQRVETDFFGALRAALEKRPLMVGITCYPGRHLGNALAISRFIKAVSDVPVVFGGSFAGLAIDEFLDEPTIDYVVQGEGEMALRQLADALAAGRKPTDVGGVFYRDGQETRGRRLDTFLDLDALPDLPYQLLEKERYFGVSFGKRNVTIETSRGCPFTCGYCYNTIVHASRWRSMSAGRALEFIQASLAATPTGRIQFTDDNFFHDLDRACSLIQGLERLKTPWSVQGVCLEDIARMDDAMLRLLRRSRCEGLFIGIQSGSPRLVEMFSRNRLDLDKVGAVNRRLRDHGIPCWYYFMCAFPTETHSDLLASAALAVRLVEENPLACTSPFYAAAPYPGTPLFEIARNYGWPERLGLDHWAQVEWDAPSRPWLTDEHRRKVEKVYFLSLFHDLKSERFVTSLPISLFATLYRPLARYRLRNLDFRLFGLEEMLRRLAFRR